jgi:hypothetical protein
MKRLIALVASLLVAFSAAAHVSPIVQIVQKGEFVRAALTEASAFFEHKLDRNSEALRRLAATIGWQPTAQEIKIYVGRDEQQQLVGSVVFLRVPSEHGPVGLGVAFDTGGSVLRCAVTEVGSEPLTWVRALIDGGALESIRGAGAGREIDAAALAPQVDGRMSRYYAEVIAEGVERAGIVAEAEGLTTAAKSNP